MVLGQASQWRPNFKTRTIPFTESIPCRRDIVSGAQFRAGGEPIKLDKFAPRVALGEVSDMTLLITWRLKLAICRSKLFYTLSDGRVPKVLPHWLQNAIRPTQALRRDGHRNWFY